MDEDLQLFVKEGDELKTLRVPLFVVRDLLRDRLGEKDVARIHRLASPVPYPEVFKAGSVIVDFSSKTAHCYDAKLNLEFLEPTWNVLVQKMTLGNY